MTDAWAHVADAATTAIELHVPARGPWWADVEFEQDPDLSGAVVLTLGAVDLHGIVAARFDGTFGLRRRSRIVGGAGGWGALLPPKAYHNDAGVSALVVAQDAAREAGETLGAFVPAADRLDVDYVREAGPASRVLEEALGGASWWVDFDGVTQTGARQPAPMTSGAYDVLSYDPRSRVAEVALTDDDLSQIGIGSVLVDRLDAPETVRELVVDVSPERVRVHAWCGGDTGTSGRLTRLIRAIIARATDDKIYGPRKYRVGQISGDRVHLQAVRQAAGLPTILYVSMSPGLAGAHAELALGSEVLVEFVDGLRTEPIVTHFAGKDGVGWVPMNTTIDVQAILKLGAAASSFVGLSDLIDARVSAIVSGFNAHTHTGGTISGSTGVPATPIPSQASTAATKVKAE